MEKGISPLVAAVLLIAATMAIATVLTYWASTFVRVSLPPVANQTFKCTYANFKIYSCNKAINAQAKANITLILQNKGTVDLGNFTLLVFLPNGSIPTYPLTGTLPAAIPYQTFTKTDVEQPYNKLIVASECSDLYDENSCQ